MSVNIVFIVFYEKTGMQKAPAFRNKKSLTLFLDKYHYKLYLEEIFNSKKQAFVSVKLMLKNLVKIVAT